MRRTYSYQHIEQLIHYIYIYHIVLVGQHLLRAFIAKNRLCVFLLASYKLTILRARATLRYCEKNVPR